MRKLVLFWLFLLAGLSVCPAQSTFTNPIFGTSADPSWIYVQSTGKYYAVRSGCGQTNNIQAVCIRSAATIPALASATWYAVYTAPATGPNSTNLWAPQIRYFAGLSQPWYIYYTAVSNSADSDDHRLFALTPIASSNITGTNSWQPAATGNASGQINPGWVNSSWAIDPDLFQASDSNYYLLFACRQNNDETNDSGWYQSICIGPMSSPLLTSGNAVALSEPTQPWETRGFPTEEGPFGITYGGTDYILFSVSSSGVPDDYAVAMLSNNHPAQSGSGNSLLNPAAWIKQGPLFDGHNYAYGTASTVLTTSPDGSQLWNAYHGTFCLEPTGENTGNCPTDSNGYTWNDRSVRAQPAGWSSTGQLVLGYPVDVVDAGATGSSTPALAYPVNNGGYQSTPTAVSVLWGNAFGDAAENDPTTTDGEQTPGIWTASGNGVAASSVTGSNFDASFFYGNPNFNMYTVFTDIELGTSDNTAPHPKAGVYGAYVDHANYYIAMIDPICGGTPASPTPCVTVSGVAHGTGGSTFYNCPLSQLPARAVFNPTGTNSLAIEVANSTYNVFVNGIELTGACAGLTFDLQGANQPQANDANNSFHASNGQAGVITQDMPVTYTNFNISYGVPSAPATGLSQLYALQSLLSNRFNVDSGGSTASGSAAVQTYTTAKNPATYTNATPPAPVSWTANTQLWQLRTESGGAFQITNAANGLCLDLSGSNVVQNTCGSAATQNWWFVPIAAGSSFLLQNASTLTVIDASSGTVNTQLVANTRNNSSTSQKWQLIPQ